MAGAGEDPVAHLLHALRLLRALRARLCRLLSSAPSDTRTVRSADLPCQRLSGRRVRPRAPHRAALDDSQRRQRGGVSGRARCICPGPARNSAGRRPPAHGGELLGTEGARGRSPGLFPRGDRPAGDAAAERARHVPDQKLADQARAGTRRKDAAGASPSGIRARALPGDGGRDSPQRPEEEGPHPRPPASRARSGLPRGRPLRVRLPHRVLAARPLRVLRRGNALPLRARRQCPGDRGMDGRRSDLSGRGR